MPGAPPREPVDDDRATVDAAPAAGREPVPGPVSVGRDRIVTLDAGASTLRAAVFDGGDELTRRTEHLGLPHPGAEAARTTIRERVVAMLARLGHGPYSAVVLATTGIRRLGNDEETLRVDLSAQLGAEVLLANDVVAAYLGALGPAPGLLLHAGSGSLVLALPTEGDPVVLDGWGHLAGDRGSGFMLGRAGLRAAYDTLDGLAPPTRLTELLLGRDPEQMITDLHSSPDQVREVAALAPHVLRAAAEGDVTAQRLLEESVDALVRAGVAAVERAGMTVRDPADALPVDQEGAPADETAGSPARDLPHEAERLQIAGIGGLFEDAHYRGTLTARVRRAIPQAELHLGGGDPLRGGLLLHTTADDPFTRALTRVFGEEAT